ncbi:hypothetical protein [Vibrio gazogenes]|uniref:hypothetical protein n=1 Tax=Vibrio gazogenes TaxID=687 RepID=UPI001041D68F|nr:hypothetical protein [Vibrio gazogenes]
MISQAQTLTRPLIQVRHHHQVSITHIIKANSDLGGNDQSSSTLNRSEDIQSHVRNTRQSEYAV